MGIAAAIGIGTIGGALISSNAASKATNAQLQGQQSAIIAQTEAAKIQAQAALEAAGVNAEAAKYAAGLYYDSTLKGIDEQRRQFDIGIQMQMPWYEAGLKMLDTGLWAQDELKKKMQKGPPKVGDYWGPWSSDMYEKSPYYDFILGETVNALDRSAAARGKLNSGEQQRAVMDYGHNLASTDYDKARSNYYQDASWDRTVKQTVLSDYYNSLSPYQTMSGLTYAGSGTATNLANMGTNFANALSNAYNQAGQAQAGGVLGAANATANGLYGVAGANAGLQDAIAQNALNVGNINASGYNAQANIWNNAFGDLGYAAGYGSNGFNNLLNPGTTTTSTPTGTNSSYFDPSLYSSNNLLGLTGTVYVPPGASSNLLKYAS